MYGLLYKVKELGNNKNVRDQKTRMPVSHIACGPSSPPAMKKPVSLSHIPDDGLLAAHGWTHLPVPPVEKIESSDASETSQPIHGDPSELMAAHGWNQNETEGSSVKLRRHSV